MSYFEPLIFDEACSHHKDYGKVSRGYFHTLEGNVEVYGLRTKGFYESTQECGYFNFFGKVEGGSQG